MTNYAITPAEVKGVARYLARNHHARIVRKRDAAQMRAVQAFLKALKIGAADRFMEAYATTLVPPLLVTKPTVYLPFRLADKGTRLQLIGHICTVGHEMHHVRQWRKDPDGFLTGYLDRAKRARIEAEALEVNMEVSQALAGRILWTPAELAEGLRAYGLRAADLRVVRKHLESKRITIEHGGMTKHESKQIVRWFERRRGAK